MYKSIMKRINEKNAEAIKIVIGLPAAIAVGCIVSKMSNIVVESIFNTGAAIIARIEKA